MKVGDRVLSYIVERELGEGGMGTVYLGRHTVLDQQVAIKALSPMLARDEALRMRFIQEANIQAKLRHPGIVQVLTAEMEGEQPSLVMEYIEGKSLSEVLDLRDSLPVDDAIKIMTQVLSAVDYAHDQGVIHRDLKPSNVMVMARGEAKVTDFGIAKVLGSSKLTRTGTAMGSAHYMSPEQIRRPETVDVRSDIYALGCVFYEVLAGQPPFGEKDASGTESDFEIKTAHVAESAPTLEKFKPDLPEWLAQLVMQMLEKEPERRPSSCGVILERLRQGDSDNHGSLPPQSNTHDELATATTNGVFSDDFNDQADKENQSDDQNQPQKPKEDSNHMVLVVLAGVVSLILYGGLGFNLKEIAILNVCLFAGYWIISNIFDKKK